MGLLCMAYLLEHDKKDVSKYISRDHSCHFWIWNHIWTDLAASVSPDVIRLRYFEKVELQPGETKKVVMKLKGSDLAFVGQDRKWRLEQGRFRMKCGSEILYIDCEKDKIWDTPNID